MTTTKQSTANPCAYFKGYSVCRRYFADTIFKLIFCLKIGLFWLKIVLIRSWGTSPFSEQLRAGKRNHEAKGIKVNHHMMTSSNGNIFRVTGPLWGNSPVIGEFPSHRSVTRSFHVFFDLRLNKRLSKQSWDWLFETPSGSLWRHCNENNCQKKSSHPIRGIRPSVGQSETALLEILKSYWAHCHAKVRFSLFPYGICVLFLFLI